MVYKEYKEVSCRNNDKQTSGTLKPHLNAVQLYCVELDVVLSVPLVYSVYLSIPTSWLHVTFLFLVHQ